MDSEIVNIYGNRVRIRVCGLCWQQQKLLLVNHKGLSENSFWAPPGGGVEFGQSLEENLEREFLEETNLSVKIGRFLFGCEFIHAPLHAVELFFETTVIAGTLKPGFDPEIQLIETANFLTAKQIRDIPANQLHGIFKIAVTPGEFSKLGGFYRI